eukprot:jgi/Bigna1/70579/fgenesh1_pg.12_\
MILFRLTSESSTRSGVIVKDLTKTTPDLTEGDIKETNIEESAAHLNAMALWAFKVGNKNDGGGIQAASLWPSSSTAASSSNLSIAKPALTRGMVPSRDYEAILTAQLFAFKFPEAYEVWKAIPEEYRKEDSLTLNRIALYTSAMLEDYETTEQLLPILTSQNPRCAMDLVESVSLSSYDVAARAFRDIMMLRNKEIPLFHDLRHGEWTVDVAGFPRITSAIAICWFMDTIFAPALRAWNEDISDEPPRVSILWRKDPSSRRNRSVSSRQTNVGEEEKGVYSNLDEARRDFVVEYLKHIYCPLQDCGKENISLYPNSYSLHDWVSEVWWERRTQQFLKKAVQDSPGILHDWMREALLDKSMHK